MMDMNFGEASGGNAQMCSPQPDNQLAVMKGKRRNKLKESIVRLRVNPPHSVDPALMEDVYLDTATLELLYAPPVSLTGDNPALSNLSAVFMWYCPKPCSDDHEGITLGSYIIPSAFLVISPRPNGKFYDVKFEITDKPTVLYYDYNSYKKRYAFYEVRSGRHGLEIIYLKPVKIFKEHPPRDKVIKGIALQHDSDMPKETFLFDKLGAKIHCPQTHDPEF